MNNREGGPPAVGHSIVPAYLLLLVILCCSAATAVDWGEQEIVSRGERILDPAIAVGTEGTVHVVRFESGWEYTAGFVYNRRVSGAWTADETLGGSLDADWPVWQ
jgi:hypothetical protein